MFSKLDGFECQDGKRDSGSRKSSFLIRDILEEGDVSEEELCVDRLPSSGTHPHHPPPTASALLGLQQGIAVWDQPLVPAAYPVVAAPLSSHEEQVLLRGHQRSTVCSGNLTLCCLNCPPQSWHPGFTDIISPTPTAAVACAAAAAAAAMLPPSGGAGVNAAASTAVSWSCLGGGSSELHQVSGKDAAAAGKGGGGPPRKVRRNRTVFTELQLMGLERRFDCQKYLSTPDRAELARALGLTQLQVKTWYQNRRMKWKKQVMQGGCTVPPTKPKGRPKKNSIPSLNDSQNRVAELGLKDGF